MIWKLKRVAYFTFLIFIFPVLFIVIFPNVVGFDFPVLVYPLSFVTIFSSNVILFVFKFLSSLGFLGFFVRFISPP